MIMDHLDKLELPDHLRERYHNERVQFCVLSDGLHYLHHTFNDLVRKARAAWAENSMALPREVAPQGLIRCLYDWYSVSACSLVRLVGWLARECGSTDLDPVDYVKRVIPTVYTYRNKVAAHFAKTDPRRDGDATLFASTMPSLSWVNGIPEVGTWRVTMRKEGQVSQSDNWRWSLIETHAQLRERYWPQAKTGAKSEA